MISKFFKLFLLILCFSSISLTADPLCRSLFDKDLAAASKPTQYTGKKSRLTKEKFAGKKAEILQALKATDLVELRLLLEQYPQLKNQRWTHEEDPAFFKQIGEDYKWCPKGWGLLQIAAYLKEPNLLNLFLNLNVNVRARKTKGGESIEDNALHIALRRNYTQGIEIIFSHLPRERFGSKKQRFIDEKSHDKKTPWFLAIKRDREYKKVVFTHMVGQYEPSGFVESYIIGRGPRDGFDVANSTGQIKFIKLAQKYLKISSNYKKYKDIKLERGKRTKAPNSFRNDYHPSFKTFEK
ncbi:MAG: hypothetical protein ACR2M7_02270 [Bdellovibrionales bacterium]